MNCPHCAAPITRQMVTCPRCHLSLERHAIERPSTPAPTPQLHEVLGDEQPTIEKDPESQGAFPLAAPVAAAQSAGTAASAGKSLGGALARWSIGKISVAIAGVGLSVVSVAGLMYVVAAPHSTLPALPSSATHAPAQQRQAVTPGTTPTITLTATVSGATLTTGSATPGAAGATATPNPGGGPAPSPTTSLGHTPSPNPSPGSSPTPCPSPTISSTAICA